ncbi:MAG: Carboxypeptidase regulatory-like domain [Chthonomonadales bacterium]|nr:Carboxypeptidase regulatory-like domain [Chthonomonadales bacterium]
MRTNAIYKLGVALGVFCAFAIGLTGCGGGGGGGTSNPVTVTGTVLSVDSTTIPTASVKIGGQTVTTDVNGKFSIANVSASTTTGSVTATGEQPLTLTLSLKKNAVNDLGTLYLSDVGYTAKVTGRVVKSVSGVISPVGGATVTIANATTISALDGTFTLNNLPVGLGGNPGVVGKISATDFEDKALTAENLQFPLAAGANPIGDQLLAQPSGSTPTAPYTIKGVVTVGGVPTANVSVSLATGGISLGSTTTDATGTYTFWVVPATYQITAVASATSQQTVTATLVKLDTPITVPTIALP